jgi:hypothetical protein
LFGSLSTITNNLQSAQTYNDSNLQQANLILDTDTTPSPTINMPTPNNSQWPFMPTDARPLFSNPEPGSEKPPAYTGHWIYADQQARKRRHSETSSINYIPLQPTSSQKQTTYASYLAEQAHLARKVRVTPSLLVNQNSQRFCISDIGDHIVDWAAERLKPAARYLALPCHYLQCWRHQWLALESRGARICRHINEKDRAGLRRIRNVNRFLERVERVLEEYSRRRNSEEGPHRHGNGDVEMEDMPLPTQPGRNFNLTVEDVEEDGGIDLEEDEGEVIRENMRDPSPNRRHHQGPLEHAEFVDLDDDESEVLMDLRQEYNAIVDDLEDFAMLQEQLPRFGQQDDAAGNEAPPPAVQSDGIGNGGADPPLPVRDDVEDGRNGNSSSSSSDDGSNNEEQGQAPPVRNSEHHGTNFSEADPGPIQPRPESVLLPAHLIPAQIMRLIPVRSRRRKTMSTTLEQDKTYAEYDRFQEMTSQHPSLLIPRRSARIAALK